MDNTKVVIREVEIIDLEDVDWDEYENEDDEVEVIEVRDWGF